MATVDRKSPHAVLRRAMRTTMRAEYLALHGDETELADDIHQAVEQLQYLVRHTAPADNPPSASPRRCA